MAKLATSSIRVKGSFIGMHGLTDNYPSSSTTQQTQITTFFTFYPSNFHVIIQLASTAILYLNSVLSLNCTQG